MSLWSGMSRCPIPSRRSEKHWSALQKAWPTRGKQSSASSKPCSASGSRWARSAIFAAPTGWRCPAIWRRSSCWQAARSWAFSSAKFRACGNGTQWFAPEVAGLAFNTAFFVGFVGRAKLTLEPPVGAERDEACGLLPAKAAQDLLHRGFQVVISQNPEDALEILEGMFVSFQERLLSRPLISAMEGRSAHHAAHREHRQWHSRPVQLRPCFVPIHLAFLSRRITLRHAGRAR